jgi:hypothetical protein
MRDDIAVNDEVEWRMARDRILVFDEAGRRL